MTTAQAMRFIHRHGIVLEAAQGLGPSLAAEALGGSIRGSWWAHRRAKEFFWLTRAIRQNPQTLVCRLAGGKITYVHRRLWPALARLAGEIDTAGLAAIREVHTPRGKHEVEETPFPDWLPRDVRAAARRLSRADAVRQLGPFARSAATASTSERIPRAGRARVAYLRGLEH